MFGWRGRIGVLVPPGNPTVEPELYRMVPDGVTLHFARMHAPPLQSSSLSQVTLVSLSHMRNGTVARSHSTSPLSPKRCS